MNEVETGKLLPVLSKRAARAWARGDGAGGAERPAAEQVETILAAVRSGGDAALLELAARFDGGPPNTLRVPAARCREALDNLEPERRAALELARDNIARTHEAQRREERPIEPVGGVRLWREFRPIRRVGVYVPGGRAAYPSSLLMSAVPAKIAGCAEVVACSPAGPGGEPAASVLAAAALVEVDELYAVGGAQAIAAFAFGTESIRPVDKIFGPGGGWVNAAKLALFDTVAIDLPAGPSEVLVWADPDAVPDRVAAELLAQAEHGPDSRCGLVLDGGPAEKLGLVVRRVRDRLRARLAALPSERREAAALSLARGAAFIAEDQTEAADWIDAVAPEHLSILAEDARERLAAISSAGAAFLGDTSPVAAGDYCTGANHVLPTGGRGRGAGGLDLDAFGRWISVQELSEDGLRRLASAIETLAAWEGLPAHAASVRAALEGPAAATAAADDVAPAANVVTDTDLAQVEP